MTAPITPDERAAMRARYPAGPIHESGLLAMGMRALDDVPRLLGALDAAEAEVARMVARPAPAWDEEATRVALVDAQLASVQQVMEDGYPSIFVRSNEDAADAALAVVRDNPPVKPGREAVAQALAEHRLMGGRCRCGLDPRLDYYRYEQHVTDAVLAEWPGESRAQVEATALRDAVEKYAVTIPDALGYKVPAVMTEDLLARADRLAAEGGVDRG